MDALYPKLNIKKKNAAILMIIFYNIKLHFLGAKAAPSTENIKRVI